MAVIKAFPRCVFKFKLISVILKSDVLSQVHLKLVIEIILATFRIIQNGEFIAVHLLTILFKNLNDYYPFKRDFDGMFTFILGPLACGPTTCAQTEVRENGPDGKTCA